MLLLSNVKEHQLGNLFLTYALVIHPVYHGSVFIPFSVSNGDGDQMTLVLNCTVSPSPWVSLLGRL